MYRKILSHIFLIVLIGAGCTTEKNTSITRTYHNTTSRYNIYFNASESYKEGVDRLENDFDEDFTRLLPVFPFGDENSAGGIKPQMSRTQEKASKIITLHSITAKPEIKEEELSDDEQEFYDKNEYNKWVDDSYLLIAKSHFLTHDFDKAKEAFRYIIKEYPEEPIVYEARIWLARAHVQTENLDAAEGVLQQLKTDMAFPDEYQEELHTTLADYYIHRKNFTNAAAELEEALEYVRKKEHKIRYTFILGQLYELTDQLSKASDAYTSVIKMNPPYEMNFNAQINRAAAFNSDRKNAGQIKDDLFKMLKDEKNKDYQDQIYYALGNIEQRQGNIQQAIEYYSLSAQNSTQNNRQKAISFLSIADIYYEQPAYEEAQAYYDSAIVFLDDDYPGYEDISSKAENLTTLVLNLNMASLEDSLQLLAQLPEKEVFVIIDNIIEQVVAAEAEQQRLEREAMLNQQFGTYNQSASQMNQGGAGGGGAWYFYNISAKGFGETEFQRKWGNRKLEDNWRRSSKKVVSFEQQMAEGSEGSTDTAQVQKKALSNKSREFYLQNIPVNDSMMQASDARLKEGLFNAALVYLNELQEKQMAVETFNRLISRYDGGDFVLLSLYQLYSYYNDERNVSKADIYKQRIINEYPESLHAQLLKNPEYLKEIEDEHNKLENLYQQTYAQFSEERFADASQSIQYAMASFPENELAPKFYLLEAMLEGKTGGPMAYRSRLDTVVTKFPGTEEATRAKEIMANLENFNPDLKAAVDSIEAREIYNADIEGPHFFGMVINSKEGDENQAIFNLINLNLDNYPDAGLNVNSEILNGTHQIILVKQFADAATAMDYLAIASTNAAVVKDIKTDDVLFFVISPENLRTLIEDKNAQKYMLHFNRLYK